MLRILAVAFGLTALLGATAARAVPQYDFTPVTADMQSFVQAHSLDGASLRVNKAGNVVYRRAFGQYTLGTRVRIASASKWLSALTLARLVEKGQMRWTDTVGQYFPAVEPAKRAITLEQLFSHTSGLPGGDDSCMSNPLYTLASCANRILQQSTMIGEPGKVFSYGGNSMQVAGRMAELATGKTWDDLFLDEMVAPLGLNATDFATASSELGYVRTANPRIAGGVRSTLEDYGKVVDMVLANGCLDNTLLQCLPSRRFLSRVTIETMALDRTVGTVDVSRPPPSTGYGYGLGQWIDPASPLIVSSPGAFGFTPWVDRVNGIAGVFLVDDLNTRVVEDIDDIRALVNTITAEGQGRRVAPVLPAEQTAAKLQALRPARVEITPRR